MTNYYAKYLKYKKKYLEHKKFITGGMETKNTNAPSPNTQAVESLIDNLDLKSSAQVPPTRGMKPVEVKTDIKSMSETRYTALPSRLAAKFTSGVPVRKKTRGKPVEVKTDINSISETRYAEFTSGSAAPLPSRDPRDRGKLAPVQETSRKRAAPPRAEMASSSVERDYSDDEDGGKVASTNDLFRAEDTKSKVSSSRSVKRPK